MIISFSSIQRFLNLELSNSILDLRIAEVPSHSACSMSQATLAYSMAKMLLNYVGLTPLKMALRAFQLLDDCLFSSIVQSSLLLGTSFLDSSFLVGGVLPTKTVFHASLSMDLMNTRMRAF